MAKMKLKKGDEVIVISGADKGKKGRVLKLLPAENRVIVEGIKIAKCHLKPSTKSPRGGIEEKELPVAVSNVAFIDPKKSRPTKLGYKFLADKKKVRFARLSGESLD